MSLFVCDQCNCIENTACCGYWWRGDGKKLCSECDPQFKKWHGRFPKREFNPETDEIIDGFVAKKEQTND